MKNNELNYQGIYVIVNDVNDDKYVGQSVNVLTRWFAHKRAAANNTNPEFKSQLHTAMRNIGESHFRCEKLEEVAELEKMDDREIYWIEELGTFENGYNATIGGNPVGVSNPGELNSRAILKEEEVYTIRELYGQRTPFRTVLKIFEDRISKRGLQKVWHGETWKNCHMDVYTEENKKWHSTAAKGFSQEAILGNNERIPSKSDINEMLIYYSQGLSYVRISEILPWSQSTIRRYCMGFVPKSNEIRVRNKETGLEFSSLAAAGRWANCDPKSISKLLKGARRKGFEFAGSVSGTQDKATWEYV